MAKRKKKLSLLKRLKQNWKVLLGTIIVIMIWSLIGITTFNYLSLRTTVLTIDRYEYTKADYMVYLYSVKLNKFGQEGTRLNRATLDSMVSGTEVTVRTALREQTLTELKTAATIKRIAHEHKITLSDDDMLIIEQEKREFINSIGGRREFNRMLRLNQTNEAAYDKMARTDRLFQLIIDNIYGDGKEEDLSAEEKEQARREFRQDYVRLRQIVISKYDADFDRLLPTEERLRRERLMHSIREIVSNDNFDDLIELHSDVMPRDDAPYDLYYKLENVIEEVRKGIKEVEIGDISDVIETERAFYIIQRLPLEDTKLEDIYNERRQEKLLVRISRMISDINITYHNAFARLRIR